MRFFTAKTTMIATVFTIATAGTGVAQAAPVMAVPAAKIDTAISADGQVHTIHHVHRRYVRRHAVVVVPKAPNRSVTVNGVNGSASASRSVTGNGDGTWSAERTWSVENDFNGNACQGSRSYDSSTGRGTIERSCR